MSFLLAAALSAAVAADGPAPRIEDGWVVASMTVDAPLDVVRDAIPWAQHDPSNQSAILAVEARVEGRCHDLQRTTRGLWHPFTLHTRMCPTKHGWAEELLEKGDYDRYRSRWTLTAVDGGTRIDLRSTYSLSTILPDALVASVSKGGVRDALLAVEAHVRSRAGAPAAPAVAATPRSASPSTAATR